MWRHRLSRWLSSAISAVLLLTVAGCQSQSDPASDLAEFRDVAIQSCERAMTDGVLEHTVDYSYQAVMVPKDQAVEDYSAAWFEEPDTYSLIYETDFFFACADANMFSLHEEAGMESTIRATKTADGFETFDQENPRQNRMKYVVQEGLIRSASNQDVEEPIVIEIEYGPDLQKSQEIIKRALEQASY